MCGTFNSLGKAACASKQIPEFTLQQVTADVLGQNDFTHEGIYTFDSKCELLITIMSSLAQEESRSISENITWGQRKSFADGKIHQFPWL